MPRPRPRFRPRFSDLSFHLQPWFPTVLWLLYNFFIFEKLCKCSTDENSKIRSWIRSRARIRIRWSEVRIRGSRSWSVPKCQGSATLNLILHMHFLPLPVPLRGNLFPTFNFPCLAVLVVRPGGFNAFSGMTLDFSFIYIYLVLFLPTIPLVFDTLVLTTVHYWQSLTPFHPYLV